LHSHGVSSVTGLRLGCLVESTPEYQRTDSHLDGRRLVLWQVYLLAFAATAITLGIRLALADPVAEHPILAMFMVPILFSAYLGGFRAGLVATTTACAAASYYLLPPIHSFAIDADMARWHLLIFALAGLITSVLGELLQRARRQAQVATRESRKAEARVRASEVALRRSVDRLNEAQRIGLIGDWEFDLATQTIAASPQAFAIMGRDPQLGPPLNFEEAFQMFEPASRAQLEEKVALAIASGEPQVHELAVLRPDGRLAHVHAKAVARKDASGRIVGLLGTVQDITERKSAEAALRDSEKMLSAVLENMSEGVMIADAERNVIYQNPASLRIVGFEPNNIGRIRNEDIPVNFQGWDELGHPLDAEEWPISRVVRGERVHNQVLKVRRADTGHEWIASYNGSPIYDDDGRIVVSFITIHDITERKRVERALHESHSLLQMAGRIAHFGGWSVNLADGQQAWSDEVARIHGETPGFVPSVTDGINYYAPEWRDKLAAVFGDCVRHGTPFDDEMQIITAQGRRVWVRSAGEAARDATGAIIRVQGAFQDIDERKQAEEHVRRLNSELEQRVVERTAELESANAKLQSFSTTLSNALRVAESAEQAKSRFLATMSHELRTPLNSIIGFTDIILGGLPGPLNSEQAKQLAIVRGSAGHLLALINDVLDISRIEAGKFEVRAELFDLRAMTERVTASIKPLADKKGLTLTAVVSPSLSGIVSDRLRVEQILLNLLSNAVKFTEHGGVTLTVDKVLGLEAPPGGAPCPAVCIRVTDTGIGVRPEDMATLFQPFRQAESGRARAGEGTGLGLAISRRLATLLGGEISAVSELAQGSTFTFTLPLVEAVGESPHPPLRGDLSR